MLSKEECFSLKEKIEEHGLFEYITENNYSKLEEVAFLSKDAAFAVMEKELNVTPSEDELYDLHNKREDVTRTNHVLEQWEEDSKNFHDIHHLLPEPEMYYKVCVDNIERLLCER